MKVTFKILLLLLLVIVTKLSHAQQYGQLVQTPLLLHPSYAGKDTHSIALVTQLLTYERTSNSRNAHFYYKNVYKSGLITADFSLKNNWSIGSYAIVENRRFLNNHSFDTIRGLDADSINSSGFANAFTGSLFLNKDWISKNGKYVWSFAAGVEYFQSNSEISESGAQYYFYDSTNGATKRGRFNYFDNSHHQFKIPGFFTAIALRSKRLTIGLNAGFGRELHNHSYEVSKFYSKSGAFTNTFDYQNKTMIFFNYSYIIEAYFPKRRTSFFSFHPIISLSDRINVQKDNNKGPSLNSYYNFGINHVSANFRIGKIPFGVGFTNDFANVYAGYNFNRFSLIAGYLPGNYSIGARYYL